MFIELKTILFKLPNQTASASGTFTIKQTDGVLDVIEFYEALKSEKYNVIVCASSVNDKGDEYDIHYDLVNHIVKADGTELFVFSTYCRGYDSVYNRKKVLEFDLKADVPQVKVTSYSS